MPNTKYESQLANKQVGGVDRGAHDKKNYKPGNG